VLSAIISALYTREQWPPLQRALANAVVGDPTGLFQLSDAYNQRDETGHHGNELDALTTISCADDLQRFSVDQVRRLQTQWRGKYPLFGGPLAMTLLSCLEWPVAAKTWRVGAAKDAPPILVVGTTGDPATPYRNTQRLASALGTGVVVTWQGEGHTAYPKTRCIRETVDHYLLAAEAPHSRVVCPAG
jgi:hypothetical protein